MKYTINWLERVTTSTGKVKANVTLNDEEGNEQGGITIWDSFPHFNDLRPGSEVEGDVVVKQNGKYTNKTLYPYQTRELPKEWKSAGSKLKESKTAGIAVAMETKKENIKEAQEERARGIKLAGINRDATLICIEMMKQAIQFVDVEISKEEFQKSWLEWRKWLSDNYGDDVPFV